jgi:hypothetical protein
MSNIKRSISDVSSYIFQNYLKPAISAVGKGALITISLVMYAIAIFLCVGIPLIFVIGVISQCGVAGIILILVLFAFFSGGKR